MNNLQSYFAVITLLCLLHLPSGDCDAKEFKMVVTAAGDVRAEGTLKFEGDLATATFGDEVEEFDLKQMKWRRGATDKWATLEEGREWAKESREKSLQSVEEVSEQVRPFVKWLLDPTFESDAEGETLRLTSGQIDYIVEGRLPVDDPDRYFRYAVLNAYKKAMTEKKFPPFAELKAIEAMQARGFVPRKISITMSGIPKQPKVEMELTESAP